MQGNTTPVDNPISRGFEAYKKVVPSPLLHSLIIGGALYGTSRLAWNPIVETIRSIARTPGKALAGLSDAEWEEAMDELKNDSSYRYWIPAAIGTLAASAGLAGTYQPTKQYNGWMSWDAPTVYYKNTKDKYLFPDTSDRFTNEQKGTGLDKKESLQKKAEDDLFEYGGYVPKLNFEETINARQAQSLFTNDPFLQNQQYVKNLGTSIVANASTMAGSNNPTLGNVFDSAVQKIENKLSFEGLASVGVKTVVSNGIARLFTGALGAMTDLSPVARRNIVDTGTWAGAIVSILD